MGEETKLEAVARTISRKQGDVKKTQGPSEYSPPDRHECIYIYIYI